MKSLLLTGAALASMPLAFAAPAAAQTAPAAQEASTDTGNDDDNGIADIVVTARRREESAQTVPVAITAFSGDALTERGATQLSDIAASVPGVFTAPGSNKGSNAPVFAIRGQLNRDSTITADPSIGLYFADVPWSRPQGANAGLIDLASVEVLKGPQGTLFGRNSTAGAILIRPNEPTKDLGGYGKLAFGNYNLVGLEAVLNLPLTDTLAFRVAATHTQRDGYLTAVNSGQRLNDLNNHTVRASLKWTPTDGFTSVLIGNYFESHTNGDGQKLIGVVPVALPGTGILRPSLVSALAATNALGKYEFLTSFAPGITGVVPGFIGITDPWQSQRASTRTLSIQNTTSIQLAEDGPLGDLTLKNIAGYRTESDFVTFETAAIPTLAVKLHSDQKISQVTEELQLQGKSGGLEYILGAFYFRESGHDTTTALQLTPIYVIGDGDVKNTSYSAFANVNYDMSGIGLTGLSAFAGIRLNNDKRSFTNNSRRQNGYNGTTYTCQITLNVIATNDRNLCGKERKIDFHEPTYSAGVNYQLARRAMIYATYGHGYRSGGFIAGATTPLTDRPFLPETVDNFEIGLKSDFDLGGMSVRLNGAAFYTKYKDIQRTVSRLVDNQLANLTLNAARANIKGAEVDLTVRPSRNLTGSISYAYIKPSYDEFIDQYRDPANLGIYPVDVSDSEFLLVSRHSISANLTYDLPVPENLGKPSISATYYYRTSFFTTNDINSPNCKPTGDPNPNAVYPNCYINAGKLPGYSLVNLRVDWRNVAGMGADLGFFVNNLTDKYYFPNALNALSTIGSLSAQVGAPRMYGVDLKVPFGASRY